MSNDDYSCKVNNRISEEECVCTMLFGCSGKWQEKFLKYGYYNVDVVMV